MFLDFFEKNSMFFGVLEAKKNVLAPPQPGKKSADGHGDRL
jgi:hypothetical protein